MLRGPGGTEPTLITQAVREGKTFDEAVALVEQLHDFQCEQWWKDLNRELILEAAGVKPKAKGKG
jgi:hypothetical protein